MVQCAVVDYAASASIAARGEEPASPEAAVAAADVELAAYNSGTLSYLAQGSDFEALDLAEHVRLFDYFMHAVHVGYDALCTVNCKLLSAIMPGICCCLQSS